MRFDPGEARHRFFDARLLVAERLRPLVVLLFAAGFVFAAGFALTPER